MGFMRDYIFCHTAVFVPHCSNCACCYMCRVPYFANSKATKVIKSQSNGASETGHLSKNVTKVITICQFHPLDNFNGNYNWLVFCNVDFPSIPIMPLKWWLGISSLSLRIYVCANIRNLKPEVLL